METFDNITNVYDTGYGRFLERLGYPLDSDQYSENRPQSVSSVAYAASIQVKIGEGLLYGFSVYSSKGSAQFIQVFDTGSAPTNGAIPVAIFTVAATANLPVEWVHPRHFGAGCWIANSSTGQTLTAGSSDTWFDVQFM